MQFVNGKCSSPEHSDRSAPKLIKTGLCPSSMWTTIGRAIISNNPIPTYVGHRTKDLRWPAAAEDSSGLWNSQGTTSVEFNLGRIVPQARKRFSPSQPLQYKCDLQSALNCKKTDVVNLHKTFQQADMNKLRLNKFDI